MILNDEAVVECEGKLAAAGRLVTGVVAANAAVVDLVKLLEKTATDDSWFSAGEAATDAADVLAFARRALRHFKLIAEARETDLADQLEELRATEDVNGHEA